jgi:hypothetical protein
MVKKLRESWRSHRKKRRQAQAERALFKRSPDARTASKPSGGGDRGVFGGSP